MSRDSRNIVFPVRSTTLYDSMIGYVYDSFIKPELQPERVQLAAALELRMPFPDYRLAIFQVASAPRVP
jgi:hypothetical protein